MAVELVRLKVDLIFTSGPGAFAAKHATSSIPIVFGLVADPLGTHLVASLARPGGNVTGMSMQSNDLATKRLELLREIVPNLRRLAIVADASNPGSVLEMGEVKTMASTVGLEVTTVELRRAGDIGPAFAALLGRVDGLYICGAPLIATNRLRINMLAVGARLPMIYNFRDHAVAGGLISYGASQPELFRRAAGVVDCKSAWGLDADRRDKPLI